MALPPDWTHTGAKWIAALLLGGASLAGMAWSLSGRRPAVIDKSDAPGSIAPTPSTPIAPAESNGETGIGGIGVPPVRATPVLESTAPESKPSARTAPGHVVNINTATQAELELLPGIGPALAQRILDYRAANGAFTVIDQLDNVKGIGPKIMARLRPLVSVE